ncbi:hypothetical protein F5X99DRAFT_430171 [Biscogniauxia marginata]|nr:hypothetical protein F5X99DRAFT_430171 [Biscogniauxia marginata]
MASSKVDLGGDPMKDIPPNAIAVTGMACKLPGADSIEEYWRILDSGSSMVTEPPNGRFPTHDHSRSTDKSVYFGNFINDIESFDNRFFKKSSREAASMDPQQRLLLETAYQALESSGFFGPHEQDLDVGCFVGVCASDYNDNVASHPPNAFSTLGTLRAFLTGKISHYFGFSGPSVTFDTACSSSAVAIDAACKAILHGDCTSAIAGGVSVFTSPHFYQNLAAASFLSHTGATKSFDGGADGYCRGEGVGLVVLKQLSRALADGDNILGTILSTSVKQSSNKVPITVPYSPSQTALYRKVLKMASVAAEDVTYLEAHGTGTPIGDPQEYEGIKETFSSKERRQPFHFASVKGNIGHTEGASGVAGLIKTLLMMQKRSIPRQASFTRVNPKINLIPGQFAIPTETIPWTADTLIACVNNYGAAGSIAAMVVKEPFPRNAAQTQNRPLSKYPLFVSANSAKSLGANCATLRHHVASFHPSSSANILADLAFHLSDRQNRSLPNIFVTTVSSMSELDDQLRIGASNPDLSPCSLNPKPNPVVLIFGGQTTRSVGLNRDVYESSALLRKHLDECDEVLKGFGSKGIYPGIFDTTPTDDVVALQTMQFALHYACAQSWIECGLKVDCVLGHSFGQLVALTVCGVFSLVDGLKLIYGRAVLMRDKWGTERGSMIALDTDRENTMGLISSVRKTNPSSGLEIACYNGPRSHVLVGSATEIESVIEVIKKTTAAKYKVLNVTHGFHSRFCDSIIPKLEELAASLTYNKPRIRVETCSDGDNWLAPTAELIADHTRTPVYFEDAVKRIEAQYKTCTWVEAGSNSSVTSIARRALSNTESIGHLYCPVNLSRGDAMGALADTTANLWKHGHQVQFWPFHRIHRHDYRPLNLPPYQFEKTRHWLEFDLQVEKSPITKQESAPPTAPEPVTEQDPVLITFSGFQDPAQQRAVFTIDPRSAEWQELVKGHAVLEEPLCPAPLYVELVLQAARELACVKNISSTPFARLDGLEITSALGTSLDKIVKLILTQSDQAGYRWDFTFQGLGRRASNPTQASTHAVGKVELTAIDDKTASAELDRIGRLLQYQKFDEIAASPDGEAVHGTLVYKVFSRVVQYHDFYKGVRKVAGNAGTVVAQVSLPKLQPSSVQGLLSSPVAIDNFLQVPGLYANCLAPCPPDEVFVCTHLDRVQLEPTFTGHLDTQWEVFAISTAIGDKESSNDVFVTDQTTGQLVFVAFGAKFNRVRITSLAKVISRANVGDAAPVPVPVVSQINGISTTNNLAPTKTSGETMVATSAYRQQKAVVQERLSLDVSQQTTTPVNTEEPQAVSSNMTIGKPRVPGVERQLREMLSKMTDIPLEQFQGDVKLSDLGIDSLMATEIVSEVYEVFNISIPQEHLQDLLTFASLRDYLDARGAGSTPGALYENAPDPTSSQALKPLKTSNQGVQETPQPDLTSKTHNSDQYQDLWSRLASLLSSHLECPPSEFERLTNLADRGLDSLLCMEVMSDVEKIFGVSIDLAQLTTESNFGDLADILVSAVEPGTTLSTTGSTVAQSSGPMTPTTEGDSYIDKATTKAALSLINAPRAFESIKPDFDKLADEYEFTGFYERVYEKNSRLVLAYTVEAFADLGINLGQISPDDKIPQLNVLPKHHHLCNVLYEVLRDGKVVDYDGTSYVRSDQPIKSVHSNVLFKNIVREFPQHAKEHMLLNICGAELAKLISGKKDPLTVLFGSKANRDILEDVYSTSPMYVIMSQLLTSFLERALSASSPGPNGKFHIIELGAGTGSTTKWVVDRLVQRGIPIEYTFTDISSSLVSAGKRKFAKFNCMKYATINIEKEPPVQYQGQFDIVLSTNCIHATSNLPNSLSNINKLLRPHGFVSLVEFTTRMFWFDMVFGLLDGWWLFNDGRPYVLASPEFWEKCMRDTGFNHVSWTGGSTPESEVVRVITGFKQPVEDPSLYRSIPQERTGGLETVVFKHTDKKLPLRADIYYPSRSQASVHGTWTVGLMIHAGGHVMLSRKDVRPRQTQLLLDNGVLPVAVDYRLCPETTILEGPLVDVSDAYAWARNKLPSLHLTCTSVKLDQSRVVVIGWSTGGTLAMSLAWTSVPRGLPPPEAILVFYCPTDYEDEFWQRPNIPDHSGIYSDNTFNVIDGVFSEPITAYNIPPKLMATGGWMTPKDARSRLVLHMNWHGQTLPVLFRGLPSAASVSPTEAHKFNHLEQPPNEDIVQASPYAQIIRGNYKSPTHIVFGTKDDLIPWQQAQRTADAMRDAGIEAEITLLQGHPHLFDMYRDPDGKRWEAVLKGYRFLFGKIGKELKSSV